MSTSFGKFDPIPLQEWYNMYYDFKLDERRDASPDAQAIIDHELSWLKPQFMFVRDVLGGLFFSYEQRKAGSSIQCVALHRSKSVVLPVYRLTVPGIGTIQLRYNFYNWVVSCDLETAFMGSVDGVFDPTLTIPTSCAEGFEDSEVFGSYALDRKQFTTSVGGGEHEIYFLLRLIRMYFSAMGRYTRSA